MTAQASAEPLLSTHVPTIVAQHRVPITGEPDPDSRMDVDVALPMRNADALRALVEAVTTPGNPQYRHYLSVEQFTERFGPAHADYQKAVQFLGTSGLTIKALSANRYIILAEGRVADIERVFHIRLHLYRHPTEDRSFIAPDREPTMDLDVPVLHVSGLDDFVLPMPRVKHGKGSGTCQSGVGGSGPCGWFLGSDMRAAYYGGSSLTGSGQSLALVELIRGWDPNSVTAYFAAAKQKQTVPVNGISIDGTPVNCTRCNDDEQALDIEYAASMAPGLSQIQFYVAQRGNIDALLNRIATDNTSKQMSASFGWEEDFAVQDPLFQEMAVHGQSFITASGDYCNLKYAGPWPPEDANVTSVGGTSLVTNGPGGTYKSETGWYTPNYFAGSAGGPSPHLVPIPSYQVPFINEKNEGSPTLRNVPDISANADFTFYECWDNPVPPDRRENVQCQGDNGGTSFSSPFMAGFIALANEQAAANGVPPVGFLNPALYALAGGNNYNADLHDVVTGQCATHYGAVVSYDLMTGLGSPDGQSLINALAGPP